MRIRMRTCISRAMLHQPLAFQSLEAVFAGYAAVAPLALALYRTAETKHLRQAPVIRPVLDLGCGSGEFARLALRGTVEMGLDVSSRRLSRCRHHLGHRHLCLGNACRLPFADEAFQTVLAVSVLEHLDQPHEALAEVRRVLRPGGHLVGTATLLDMHEQLFYPRLLGRLGLSPLGRLYIRLHDRLFAHRCLLSQSQWEEMFAASGLELVVRRKIVSPRLTRWFDLLLAFAWPYRLLPRWGYSLLCRPPGVHSLVEKKLLPLCHAEEPNGSSLFFVARKPEE
jgi:ubiquinone/menaquinone biosynthesis C-methylase UbiE